MRTLKTAFGSALVVGLLSLSGCGGGGGGSPSSTSPTAPVEQAPATPPTTGGGTVQQPPTATPAPVSVILAATQYNDRVTILAQNAVAATANVVLPTTSAGEVTATPVNQTVHLNRTPEGKYFGGSDVAGTYLMNPADVDKICASSPQLGYAFLPGQSSRACAAPDLATDTVTLPKTCSRDSDLYTWHMKDGSVRWFDWTSDRKFVIPSDSPLPGVVQPDGAHVLWNGYQGATVKVVRTGPGKANIITDFGSNCVGAFGQMNDVTGTSGHLVDMSVVDGSTWLQFLFNSDKSAADGTAGWGSQPWLDTQSGYTVQPSVAVGYLDFNQSTGNYFVTIPVTCGSKGNITAYRGTRQPDGSTLYDAGTSGTDDPLRRPFGLGWLPIQANANEPQLYTLVQDPSVSTSFDRATSSLVVGDCN